MRQNQRGVSIIAAIFIIVILAFMGVMFVTLVNTATFTSLNDLESAQAEYIAEGGVEYVLENRAFPNYSMGGATMNLGAGNFTVSTPAYLTAPVTIGNNTINVNSTSGFANPAGMIVIDSEVIAYTNTTPLSFTGAGPATAAHVNGNAVYPVTRVAGANLLNNCAATDVQVDYVNNFLIPAIITIGSEYLYCTGTGAGPNRFTGCTRCYKGSVSADHAIGDNIFQYVMTSTGTVVGSAQRVVSTGVQRSGGSQVANGGFTADINGWAEVLTNMDGQSLWSNNPAIGGLPGSLNAFNNVGANLQFTGYRTQAIAIPAGTNTTLQLQFCKNAIGATSGGSRMNVSVEFMYAAGSIVPWSDAGQPATVCANAANWNAVNVNFVPANAVTAIRINYDLRNRGGGAGAGTQKQVWFDEVSVVTPGGVRALSWQEVVQ